MNILRGLTVCSVVLVLGLGVRAEEKPDYAKLVVGKWEATKTDPDTLPKGSLVEFTKDGKLKVTVKEGGTDMTIEGTYKLTGSKFEMTMKIGDMEHKETIEIVKIDAKEMSTKDKDGKAVVLTKSK